MQQLLRITVTVHLIDITAYRLGPDHRPGSVGALVTGPVSISVWRRLFRHQLPGWRHRARCSRRNCERQPRTPARRTIGRIEIAICPQAQKALQASHREDISDLRTGAENARPEATQNRTLTGIVGDLLISVSGKADENLLREKMRRTPVEVEIDTA